MRLCWQVGFAAGALAMLVEVASAAQVSPHSGAPAHTQLVQVSPRGGVFGDPELLCFVDLLERKRDLFNPKGRDPDEDAAQAIAHHDYRPAGYMRPGLIEALGTECPEQFTEYKIVLGFPEAPYDSCMAFYAAAVKPYVTSYNRALKEARKRQGIDMCKAGN